jgi:glycosyltransferase involved in cell wall biosynthesis
VACLNFRNAVSGTDTALFQLAVHWRKWCDLTVFHSTLAPQWRLDGVRYVRVASSPIHQFGIQARTYAATWAAQARVHPPHNSMDRIYATSAHFMPCDVAAVHFLATEYKKSLRRAGRPLDVRAFPRRWYELVNFGMAARWEKKVYPRAIAAGVRMQAVSADIAARLRNTYPAVRVEVIPNAVDVERFRIAEEPGFAREIDQKAGWAPDSVKLLFVGSGWERKNLRALVEALARLPPRVVGLVVGTGPVPEYKRFAESLGVGRRIFFAGERDDVEKFYRVADGFVLPSLFEAMPMATLEAMASGLPVLLYPYPGHEMVLRDGFNGFLVASPAEIAERVAAHLMCPDGRTRLRDGARATALEFAPEPIARRTLDYVLNSPQCEAR